MRKLFTALTALALVAAMLTGCAKKEAQTDWKNPHMNYRMLGNTGIEVGEIGIGCGVFSYLDTAESRQYMDIALDSGINYIDIYDADPKVRANIGYALKGRRERMVIQGHLGNYWLGEQYERTRDVEKTKKSFEDLLNLLGTDYIDVGMMHIADNMDEWNEMVNSPFYDYMKQLKAEGKIKHIGMSSHNAEVALAAAKSGLVEVIMFSLNPAFDRTVAGSNPWAEETYQNLLVGIDPVRVQLYDYCAQHGIAITVMKVFGGGGRLLDAKSSPLGFALTPTQCLAYALAKPCVSVALCGSRAIEHLVEDLHYMVATDEERDFQSALDNGGNTPQACGGECTYCNHCSPCKAGINIARVNGLLDNVDRNGGKVTPELQEAYDKMEHHASECTHCGECESRCPFAVSIRERMDKATQVFGH